MQTFQVTKAQLNSRPQVLAFFLKTQQLAHYLRLEAKFRSSPVCMCSRCNLMLVYTGSSQLRLV